MQRGAWRRSIGLQGAGDFPDGAVTLAAASEHPALAPAHHTGATVTSQPRRLHREVAVARVTALAPFHGWKLPDDRGQA